MTQNTKHTEKRPTKTVGKPARPVRTDADGLLWNAIERYPHNTAKRLGEIAGVGPSTATRALRRWAIAGYVIRVTGDDRTSSGSRQPTTWVLANSDGRTAERQRLRPGELRAAVAAYLAVPQRHGQPYTPGQIARTFGRSAGAVTNALRRLTVDGTVTQTSGRPRRFTYPSTARGAETTSAKKTSSKSRKRSS